jgi:glycerol-3-phosphate acyltransferase PlsY
MFIDILLIFLAYLLGSLSGALIVCRMMGFPDPRTQGSGNPGATNVLRYGGKKAALMTLCLDVLKGIIAVSMAQFFTIEPMVLAGVALAVFLGHLYPIFFNFRGGKGVATAFGTLLALAWQVSLVTLTTWLFVAMLFRYSALAAIIAAIFAPAYMFLLTDVWAYVLTSFIMSGLLIWRHHSNIRNLFQGQEDKIGRS